MSDARPCAVAAYDPLRFVVRNYGEAARIILTPEGSTTEARWAHETPYLLDLLNSHLPLHGAGPVVLDYGCGIGRLAKGLIERWNCTVVGVDISTSMLALALDHVCDARFIACAPERLWLFGKAFASTALAVWTLQHVADLSAAIEDLYAALRPGGVLFVANNTESRAVPVQAPAYWLHDGLDVWAALKERFQAETIAPLDPAHVAPLVAEHAQWGVFRKLPGQEGQH